MYIVNDRLAAPDSHDLVLLRTTHARRVLEIGGSTPDLARHLPAGGHLIIVDGDAVTGSRARADIVAAGLADRATVIVGEPSRYLHKIAGPFDLVIVRNSSAIRHIHERVMRLLEPGGSLLSLNLTAAEDYNEVLLADARLHTVFLDDGDVGVSVRHKDSA